MAAIPGKAACCKGCHKGIRECCYMAGQCDILDPFDCRDSFEASGIDPGEPNGDPYNFFSEQSAVATIKIRT